MRTRDIKCDRKGVFMDLNKLYRKLEAYENSAYEGGVGCDWLSEIGEKYKFYVKECEENNIAPTFEGWVTYVDKLARRFFEITMTINFTKK